MCNIYAEPSQVLFSIVCRDHLFLLPFYKPVFDQLFDDVRSGGVSAKPFAFHIIAHILYTGTLHCRKQAEIKQHSSLYPNSRVYKI